MDIGYLRVSTGEQTLGLQLDALAASGCGKVSTETAGGGKAERSVLEEDPQLLPESAAKHPPDRLPAVDQLDGRPLPEPVREELRIAVVAESCATGLNWHDGPNQRGRALQRLIDRLGRR